MLKALLLPRPPLRRPPNLTKLPQTTQKRHLHPTPPILWKQHNGSKVTNQQFELVVKLNQYLLSLRQSPLKDPEAPAKCRAALEEILINRLPIYSIIDLNYTCLFAFDNDSLSMLFKECMRLKDAGRVARLFFAAKRGEMRGVWKITLRNCSTLIKFFTVHKQVEQIKEVYMFAVENLEVDVKFYVQMLESLGELKEMQFLKEVHLHILESKVSLDLSAYNRLATIYSENGMTQNAVDVLYELISKGLKPDKVLFAVLLRKAGEERDMILVKNIHRLMKECSVEINSILVVTLIGAYVFCGDLLSAMEIFQKYQDNRKQISPGHLGILLKACGEAKCLEFGVYLYDRILKMPYITINQALYKQIILMFKKCDEIKKALEILLLMMKEFPQLPEDVLEIFSKDTYVPNRYIEIYRLLKENDVPVTTDFLSSLLTVQIHLGLYDDVISTVLSLHDTPEFPAVSIYVFLFNYCGERGFYELGKRIQQEILPLSSRANESPLVRCALLSFYGWNADIESAEKILEELRKENILQPYMINSMMHAYIFCGMGSRALDLWNKSNLFWNEKSSFLVLKAHAIQGEIQNMIEITEKMRKMKLPLSEKHKGVVSDALGKEGRFDEAETMFGQLADPNDWYRLLLSAYHHGDIERGRRYFNTISAKDPYFIFAYSVMYSFWNKVNPSMAKSIIDTIIAKSIPMKFGVNIVEHDGKARRFRAERLNEIEEMEEDCRELDMKLQEAGWDLEELEGFSRKMAEVKKLPSLAYSLDKMAAVFLLKHSEPGSLLRINKSRLLGWEGHNLLGAISKVTGRDILVNDRTKVHHFVNGICSYCKDFLTYGKKTPPPSTQIQVD